MATTTTSAAPTTHAVWHLDPSHLEVGFAVRHLMISTVKGRFSHVTGKATIRDHDFTTAEIEATIDASSIDTREPKRDEHLRSADFLNVAAYPAITFKSRRVDTIADARHRLVGDITIHGVTKPITLDVTHEGTVRDPWGNERIGFSAAGKLDRRDFGLTWNQALELGGVVVGDEVKLTIEAELIRQAD